VSEVVGNEIKANERVKDFDLNKGCAGLAFRSKKLVFEPFAQNSKIIDKQEIDHVGITVDTLIAAPIFDEHNNSIGVLEIINGDKEPSKEIIMKFAKYTSLLLHTNNLLKVFLLSYTKNNRTP